LLLLHHRYLYSMKNIRYPIFSVIVLLTGFVNQSSSQENFTKEPTFEVNRIYPYISITQDEIEKANTLTDLNQHFKSSWIREYLSVEIMISHLGNTMKSISKSHALSQEQKNIMKMADAGTAISVKIEYMPENTLQHNDSHEILFSFSVDPDIEATYIGGTPELNKYLKAQAIDKIPATEFNTNDLAALKFTISETGEIINAHIFNSEYQTAEHKKADTLLLEAIRSMPAWKPAEYANGTRASQEFVLLVGNMESCLVNLLNIR